MNPQAIFTIILLIGTLVVMASQRLRVDLVALLVMLLLVVSGVLSPEEAFSGFGQPVIIIVAGIFVLSAALYETGVATIIANQILRVGSRSEAVIVFVIMLMAALMTSVLGGLLVVALLMPAVLRICRQTKIAPSRLLLPLAFMATIGSQLTLIGTPGNLVVSDILMAAGYAPLELFTLTPYGLVSVGVVMVWFLLPGRRFLRRVFLREEGLPSLEEVQQDYKLDKLLYRLRVRSGSNLIDKLVSNTDLSTQFGLNLIAFRTALGKLHPASADLILEQDGLLIVTGEYGHILQAANYHNLEIKGAAHLNEFSRLEQKALRLAEVIVPVRSNLVGRTLADVDFRARYEVNTLAVQRQGRAIRKNLSELKLIPGDTLLVQGSLKHIKEAGRDMSLVFMTDLGPQPGDLVTGKAGVTLAILGIMLVVVVSGVLSLATAGLMAAVALVLTGCISLKRAYQSLNLQVIVLIAGMLPLASALEKTGAAGVMADWILQVNPGGHTLGALILLYLTAAVITQVISNSVVAALMMPIAINLALAQGVQPEPFAIVIAFAVNAAYVTPFTDGDNLVVREPGQYTMRDYIINGMPIFVIQTALLVLMLTLNYIN